MWLLIFIMTLIHTALNWVNNDGLSQQNYIMYHIVHQKQHKGMNIFVSYKKITTSEFSVASI